MMNNLMINTASKSYPIYFTQDISGLSKAIKGINKDYSSFIVITDSNVGTIYSKQIIKELQVFEKNVLITVFDAGEENKILETISGFYQDMIEFGADRKSLVIALGGGVTGDMAGFTAATFMRGIDFIQIPTSLLSQVDSSVGGKTGIDFNGYKNIIGAFYQPELVYINVFTLSTLPNRELYAGMSEVLKHGFIRDISYYNFLKNSVDKVLNLDFKTLITMIKWSCQIKKDVVDQDEKEQGLRGILNFGHTFGHSIERLKNFELIHGECVSIGMHGAFLLANKLKLITDTTLNDGLDMLRAYHLPLQVRGLNRDDIYNDMFHDKKTIHKRLVFALLDDIGKSHLSTQLISKDIILECIDELITL